MKNASFIITFICLGLLLVACEDKIYRPVVAEVGKPAPDFTLVDTKNKLWKLADLKGQVVFVNFWATWCPPCREEMPSMQRLYSSMPADKFKMLAILTNYRPEIAEKMAAKMGCTFPILVDPESMTAQAYGLTGVPETYIIDKQGVVREKFIGALEWDSDKARQMLMKYIAQ